MLQLNEHLPSCSRSFTGFTDNRNTASVCSNHLTAHASMNINTMQEDKHSTAEIQLTACKNVEKYADRT